MKLALTVILRLALCAATSWVVWRYLGLAGMVATIPLYALALTRPIMDAAAAFHHGTVEAVYADVKGRYREHRGHAVDVVEDEDGHDWVRLKDARHIVPGLARDEVLQRVYPGKVQALAPSRELRIRADTLVEHLRASQDDTAVKFKVFLERELLTRRG
jgi:hypothetical protein